MNKIIGQVIVVIVVDKPASDIVLGHEFFFDTSVLHEGAGEFSFRIWI